MSTTSSLVANQRFCFLGMGGVATTFISMIDQLLPDVNCANITIIELTDRRDSPAIADIIARGAKYVQEHVTRKNLHAVLDAHVKPGDLIIDLSTGIEGREVIAWAQSHNVLYINTALELYEDQIELDGGDWLNDYHRTGSIDKMLRRTLYDRQMDLRDMNFPRNGPTAVIDHGMNPGLVSHFAKASLDRISQSVIDAADRADNTSEVVQKLRQDLAAKNYANLAKTLHLRVIHISEKDNQIAKEPKKPNEFLSTWSPAGFYEEGLDPVQVGWGTHEEQHPEGAVVPKRGPKNQIFLPARGVQLVMRSWVPTFGHINGVNIPHSEGSTLSEFLTTEDGSYRPTVHYVYDAPPCAQESWADVLQTKSTSTLPGELHAEQHVLVGHEIESGRDAVGVLLLFEGGDPVQRIAHHAVETTPWAYWAGTILSIEQTRLRSPNSYNAAPTTVQVVASVYAAAKWAIANRNEGVVWPEALPHDAILSDAGPYLGDVVFTPTPEYKAPVGLQFSQFTV